LPQLPTEKKPNAEAKDTRRLQIDNTALTLNPEQNSGKSKWKNKLERQEIRRETATGPEDQSGAIPF